MATNNYCVNYDLSSSDHEDSGEENWVFVFDTPQPQERTNTDCYMCNGFYGPCFGEPVCATCHAFLFPDYALNGECVEASTEKSDDGDSGNDEPADCPYPVDRFHIANEHGDAIFERRVQASTLDNVSHRLELLASVSRHTPVVSHVHIDTLPPEVLLVIFTFLDDFSLWSVANVCKRWQQLIMYEVPSTKWQELTLRRFPLCKPVVVVEDWFLLYSKLMGNCSCWMCLQQMAVRALPPGEEGSWRRNRLRSELKILRSDPPDGIQALPLDIRTCCHWQATIQGPAGSPYEGGLFYLYLQVPYSYPMCPPVVRFLTKIFHPNISRHGDIGIDSIYHNWSLALTLSKVLISVQSLLTDPYCEVCMEPDIGRMYVTERTKFEETARHWTWRYAMTDLMPTP